MKPKTKLQMEIVNGSRKLAPVSEAQKRYAYKHCFVHYFKRDAKGNCFCLDCGHTWRDKEDKKNCKCPHCGMNLKLENCVSGMCIMTVFMIFARQLSIRE